MIPERPAHQQTYLAHVTLGSIAAKGIFAPALIEQHYGQLQLLELTAAIQETHGNTPWTPHRERWRALVSFWRGRAGGLWLRLAHRLCNRGGAPSEVLRRA
jgi:hypothetical protein